MSQDAFIEGLIRTMLHTWVMHPDLLWLSTRKTIPKELMFTGTIGLEDITGEMRLRSVIADLAYGRPYMFERTRYTESGKDQLRMILRECPKFKLSTAATSFKRADRIVRSAGD